MGRTLCICLHHGKVDIAVGLRRGEGFEIDVEVCVHSAVGVHSLCVVDYDTFRRTIDREEASHEVPRTSTRL